jgi:hypothetical protein
MFNLNIKGLDKLVDYLKQVDDKSRNLKDSLPYTQRTLSEVSNNIKLEENMVPSKVPYTGKTSKQINKLIESTSVIPIPNVKQIKEPSVPKLKLLTSGVKKKDGTMRAKDLKEKIANSTLKWLFDKNIN